MHCSEQCLCEQWILKGKGSEGENNESCFEIGFERDCSRLGFILIWIPKVMQSLSSLSNLNSILLTAVLLHNSSTGHNHIWEKLIPFSLRWITTQLWYIQTKHSSLNWLRISHTQIIYNSIFIRTSYFAQRINQITGSIFNLKKKELFPFTDWFKYQFLLKNLKSVICFSFFHCRHR